MPDANFDGNREQHLANGGCEAIHRNGKWFCQGMVGHYNWFESRHYVRLFSVQGGYEAIEWN